MHVLDSVLNEGISLSFQSHLFLLEDVGFVSSLAHALEPFTLRLGSHMHLVLLTYIHKTILRTT
jgi:hypothetical protein